MSIGFWQILIVVALLVLLFGRGKISGLMGDVAEGIKSFRKGMAEDPAVENKSTETGANTIDTTATKAEEKTGAEQ